MGLLSVAAHERIRKAASALAAGGNARASLRLKPSLNVWVRIFLTCARGKSSRVGCGPVEVARVGKVPLEPGARCRCAKAIVFLHGAPCARGTRQDAGYRAGGC